VNLEASVAARLLNRAKSSGDDYQTLLTNFCFERFLYRLAVSDISDRFILKGAMLLRVSGQINPIARREISICCDEVTVRPAQSATIFEQSAPRWLRQTPLNTMLVREPRRRCNHLVRRPDWPI
jgi:hypothetical protein